MGNRATKKPPLKDFVDLEVWQAARELRREVYKLALALPDFEKFALASQLRRAATSVTANIAEGYGCFDDQENVRFCRQARGSLYELRDYLMTCKDQGYQTASRAEKLDAMAQRVVKILNGYMRSTRTQLNPGARFQGSQAL
ncbi:MAG TPA: four helix bundle protein [Terriglobia bacterium]|nr:four helix bundle protein [Terriglobia bacterium]